MHCALYDAGFYRSNDERTETGFVLPLGNADSRAGRNTNFFPCQWRGISREVIQFSSKLCYFVLVSCDFDVLAFRLIASHARSIFRRFRTLRARSEFSLLGPVVRPTRPTSHLSPAKVPLGPFRSIETFASPLHCAPSSQVALIAETPNTRVIAAGGLSDSTIAAAPVGTFLHEVRITSSLPYQS